MRNIFKLSMLFMLSRYVIAAEGPAIICKNLEGEKTFIVKGKIFPDGSLTPISFMAKSGVIYNFMELGEGSLRVSTFNNGSILSLNSLPKEFYIGYLGYALFDTRVMFRDIVALDSNFHFTATLTIEYAGGYMETKNKEVNCSLIN